MIGRDKYKEIVQEYFQFLRVEFNFELCRQDLRGNVFYDLRYKNTNMAVSISYENIENYLSTQIYLLQNNEFPSFYDTTKSFHLKTLTEKILPKINKVELDRNNECFSKFITSNASERQLLKSAKELRLCLNHFDIMRLS